MINFINELAETANLPINEVKNSTTFSVIDGKVLVVNNYKKILTYSKDFISLKIKDNELNIEGNQIRIKELNKSDISFVGNINKIYFAKEVKTDEFKE